MANITTIELTPGALIDKTVRVESDDLFDGKNVWLHLSGEVDWANQGCGFIYRNLRGVKKTLREALEHLYNLLGFCGGEWKLEKCEENYISYIRGNGREYIVKYNLEGPTIFDCNH